MADTIKMAQDIGEGLKNYGEASSDVISAFKKMRVAICNEGNVLDFKTRELIACAVAVSRQCQPCILSHLEVAIEAGVKREELVEALNLAILLCGGPGYAYAAFALTSFDDLVKVK